MKWAGYDIIQRSVCVLKVQIIWSYVYQGTNNLEVGAFKRSSTKSGCRCIKVQYICNGETAQSLPIDRSKSKHGKGWYCE